jgi:hypothetical protein
MEGEGQPVARVMRLAGLWFGESYRFDTESYRTDTESYRLAGLGLARGGLGVGRDPLAR